MIEIGGMWLRPDAIWAVRPDDHDVSCSIATGPGGAEFRLPGVTPDEAARLLGSEVLIDALLEST